MDSVGFIPSATPLTRLITAMHTLNDRRGIRDLLQRLLTSNARLNIVVINALISHFNEIGDVETVQQLVRKITELGLKPDQYTFTALTKNAMNRGDSQACLNILEVMRANNLDPNTVAYNHVLTSMTKNNNRQAIEKMCEEMESKGVAFDRETYHILLELYARAMDWSSASKVMKNMTKQGVAPNVRTYNILLHFAGLSRDLTRFDYLWNKLKELGPTEVSYAIKAQYTMLAKRNANLESELLQLLQKMSDADVIAGSTFFTMLMLHTAEAGLPEECEKLYAQMKAKKVLPNPTTFRCLIEAWFAKDSKDKALAVFAEMKRTHKKLINRSIYDVLFKNLWRLGLENEVIAVISDMRSRKSFVGPEGACVLLVFYAKRKLWKQWNEVYDTAKEKNILSEEAFQLVQPLINEHLCKKFEADLKVLSTMDSVAETLKPATSAS